MNNPGLRRRVWILFAAVAALLIVARVARQVTRRRPHQPHVNAGPVAADRQYRDGQQVMGTVLETTVEAADRAAARRLSQRALAVARHWDDVLTTWRPEGELARLNAAAGNGDVAIGADLAAALKRMRALSAATGGAFDPGVGALVDWWRLPAPRRAAVPRPALPAGIAAALHVAAGHARLAAGARLDAGGIGKGIALDAMGEVLRQGGATAAFLDFGGSSQLALGRFAEPSDQARVAVSGLADGELLGTVVLRAAALSTSRSGAAGEVAGAIIDPRDGEPVREPRLATVFASDATSAEAWSTALVVLGRAGVENAQRAGVEALFADRAGVLTTPGFPLVAARR